MDKEDKEGSPPTAALSGWGLQSRASEDLEYFTQLALQETQNWIQMVTGKQFKYEDHFRRSLEDGILLCELLNGLRPKTIRKINKLPTPIAGLDNINVFLEACQAHFGLKDSQLFHSCDLEDLSTRAISDSEDELKIENARRLRNVAITIFWLGKVSRKYKFSGPLLDLSVFTGLIHGGSGRLQSPPATPSIHSTSPSLDNLTQPWSQTSTPKTPSLSSAAPSCENISFAPQWGTANESLDSIDHSSAYGSYRSETKYSQSSDNLEDNNQVKVRPVHSKQDSYESFISDRSVTSDFHDESNVICDDVKMPVRYGDSSGRYSATLDQVYDANKSVSSSNNNNNSNTMDNSDGEGRLHRDGMSLSQTSLDRMVKENDMLNTRFKLQKTQPAGHPNAMQFVKTGGVKHMAEKAKDLVEIMKQQKEEKKFFEARDDDWSSNLSSWKSKMRQKSVGSLQRAQDSLELEAEKQDEMDEIGRKRTKSFKDMMEERERRKSGNYSFYPLEDSDDSAFSSSGSKSRTSENDDKLSMFGFHKVEEPTYKTRTTTKTTTATKVNHTVFDSRNENAHTGYSPSLDSSRVGSRNESQRVSNVYRSSEWSPAGLNRHGNTSDKGQDQSDSGSVQRLERLVSPRSKGGFKAWSWERKTTSVSDEDAPIKEEVASWARDEEEEEKREIAGKSNEQKSRDLHSPLRNVQQKSVDNVREFPINVQRFNSPPKESSPGFKSVRNMFEKSTEDKTAPSKAPSTHVFHESSKSSDSNDDDIFSRKSMTRSYEVKRQEAENPDSLWSKRESFENKVQREEYQPTPSISTQSLHMEYQRTPSISTQSSQKEYQRTPSIGTQSSQKHHIEKVIKISQKPEHEKGFGFTIKGGKEHHTPIKVEKVILGGAADVCELMPGDEIVAVNGALVGNHYLGSVQMVIDQAVKAGQIELRIRRSFDKAKLGLFDEEEFQMEQERMQHVRNNWSRTRSETSSVCSEQETPILPPWEQDRRQRIVDKSDAKFERNGHREDVNIDTPDNTAKKEQLDFHTDKHISQFKNEFFKDEPPQINITRSSEVHQWLKQEEQHELDSSALSSTASLSDPEEVISQDHIEIKHTESYQAASSISDTAESDEPPPLPAAPPPAPNWDTFPGAPRAAPSSDLSFLDESDLLPEIKKPVVSDPDDSVNARLEKLRLKSEFLGQNYKDTEEYRKLKEELEKEKAKEEDHWEKIEKNDNLSAASLLSRFDKIPVPKPVTVETSITSYTATKYSSNGYEDYSNERNNNLSTYSLGDNKELIDKISQQELDRQRRIEELDEKRRKEDSDKWNSEQIRTWTSMEMLRGGGMYKDINANSGYCSDDEEKFEKDQEIFEREKEEAFRRAQETGHKNKEQEEKLLEKELARQKELEEIKRKRDEDRLIRQKKDEEERKERERREEIEFRKRVHREEAERKERERREEEERRLKEQRDEANRRAQLKKEEAERKMAEKRREEELLEQREKERMRLEKERLERQEAELRAKEEQLRKEQEQIRYKEEQERKEEDAFKRKERELREREARLKVEEEKLRLQREELAREKQQSMYKSDQVSVSYSKPVEHSMGQAEYVYQHEAAPSQQLETANGNIGRTVATERTEQYEVRSAPQVAPQPGSPGPRRIIKREPLIPPKPGIKSELSGVSRQEIMDMNRRPTGQRGYDDTYQISPSQTRSRTEKQAFRKSWSPETFSQAMSSPRTQEQDGYSQARATGMSRDEVMAANRKVFTKKQFSTPERESSPRERESPSPPGLSMSKNMLHNLGAAPKSRLLGSQTWIREDAKKPARRSEVIRTSMGSLSEHWLVEEAERRRLAEQSGQERPRQDYGMEYAYGLTDRDIISQPSMSDPDILAPPQGYQMSRLSRSWQGSREQTPTQTSPTRISPSRSVGAWETDRHSPKRESRQRESPKRESPQRESPQRSHFSYSQNSTGMSTFRSPTRVTEIEKPDDLIRTQRPIPDDIKQSLIDRVNGPRDSYSSSQTSYSVSAYQYPPYLQNPSLYGQSSRDNPQYTTQHQAKANYSEWGSHPGLYQAPHYADPRATSLPRSNDPRQAQRIPDHPPYNYSQPSNVQSQSLPGHYGGQSKPYYNMQRPRESPPDPPSRPPQHSSSHLHASTHTSTSYRSSHATPVGALSDIQFRNQLERPPSSSGSIQSQERVPPVPPKPPRLLSSSSEDSTEPVVSVSASQRCSHCEKPLGQGAAMVIESLNLVYHVLCFRCCVCQTPLGSGHLGTDVRVRVSKLHCANCYSNDEVGLKFSRV